MWKHLMAVWTWVSENQERVLWKQCDCSQWDAPITVTVHTRSDAGVSTCRTKAARTENSSISPSLRKQGWDEWGSTGHSRGEVVQAFWKLLLKKWQHQAPWVWDPYANKAPEALVDFASCLLQSLALPCCSFWELTSNLTLVFWKREHCSVDVGRSALTQTGGLCNKHLISEPPNHLLFLIHYLSSHIEQKVSLVRNQKP